MDAVGLIGALIGCVIHVTPRKQIDGAGFEPHIHPKIFPIFQLSRPSALIHLFNLTLGLTIHQT